jgi:hypothetical protein
MGSSILLNLLVLIIYMFGLFIEVGYQSFNPILV